MIELKKIIVTTTTNIATNFIYIDKKKHLLYLPKNSK